jgi:SAM-dependent methyltransferase
MDQTIAAGWYEDKKNVDEMVHWNKGKLKKWEETVTGSFFQNGKVLDIGCGMGREAYALHDKGFSVTGIDNSREVIRQVTRFSKENGYDLPFLYYDGQVLPFEAASFDTVIIWAQTFGLLYGDDYKNSFLRECYRVLKTGGILSFSGHDYQYIIENYNKFARGRKFYPYDNSEIYWEMFLPEELSAFAQYAGFTVLTYERGEIYTPKDGYVLHCLCKK